MLLLSLAFYAVKHRACPPLLRGVNQRALSAEEITQACELLLARARQYDCPYWLLDGRANPRQPPLQLHQWLHEEYFPRVRAALGCPVHVAFLVTPAVREELDRLGFASVEVLHPGGGSIGWFAEEAPALAWLTQQRLYGQRLPRPAGKDGPGRVMQGPAREH